MFLLVKVHFPGEQGEKDFDLAIVVAYMTERRPAKKPLACEENNIFLYCVR